MNKKLLIGIIVGVLVLAGVITGVFYSIISNNTDVTSTTYPTTTTPSQHIHTEVVDQAVAPTCTATGFTEGRHCSECGQVLVVQQTIPANGHTEVIDAAVTPTCTVTGLTEGKHCSECNQITVVQNTIAKANHNYVVESILIEATCVSDGTKKLNCDSCSAYITESYELEKYSATEINNRALQYVGEITTYDKRGYALGLGTGFVYSSDGKIITNYHVIEGAYSAEIVINGTTYSIQKILAYDETIDLAVLKINAQNIPCATICTREIPVGSTVYAIGSSRGLTNTFSRGIVTYYNRVVDGVSHIQHDASITNGNSGGPLINEYGEVVGINTWGLNNSQNLNFAVFTAEIDNLIFGTPITLAELYESHLGAYDILLNWLYTNYNNTTSSGVCYYHSWEEDLSYSLVYDIEEDLMFFVVLYDGLGIILDLYCDPSEYTYYVECDTGYDFYTVTGEINAYVYTTETQLRNYDFSGAAYASEEDATRMAQLGVNLSVIALENLLLLNPELGLFIEDFGFISFK